MKDKFLMLSSAMILSVGLLIGCGTDKIEETEAVQTEQTGEVSTEVAGGLTFELPKGFKADETTQGLYVPEVKEDGDFSCIYYQEALRDERFSLLTEDKIAELMEEIYEEMYGIDTEVTVNDFYRFSLDGYTAYKIETTFAKEEQVVKMTEFVVESGEKSFSVTYMLMEGSSWETAFENSADTLKVSE